MDKVPVSGLRIGDHVLKFDRSWLGTDFLSHRFVIKDQATIDRLAANGIEFVFIEPRREEEKKITDLYEGRSDELINVLAQEAPKHQLNLKEFNHATDVYTESVTMVGSVLSDIRSGRSFNSSAIRSISDSIAKVTVRNRGVLASVTKLQKHDDYTFHHSMNVSVFAASLAAHLGMKENEIERVANAGLVHDIGKMLIPQEILNKPGKLTDSEFIIMKQHVQRGYDYLLKQGMQPDMLKLVLEHHERHDGSGYPNGLSDEQISIDGKIGAVVDIYDAITSDRVYNKGMAATSALKLMFSWTDSHINKSVFEFFIKNVGIYPVGSLVMMSTQEFAIVGKTNNNKPTDPIVIVFMNKNGERTPLKVVDLSKSAIDRQKIIGLINPENVTVPKDVYKYIDNLNKIA
ncbi:MAG: HD-GYP domain-containing protein [Deferribacterales bacterium]